MPPSFQPNGPKGESTPDWEVCQNGKALGLDDYSVTRSCLTFCNPVNCSTGSQASLSFTMPQSLLKLMSIESAMPDLASNSVSTLYWAETVLSQRMLVHSFLHMADTHRPLWQTEHRLSVEAAVAGEADTAPAFLLISNTKAVEGAWNWPQKHKPKGLPWWSSG